MKINENNKNQYIDIQVLLWGGCRGFIIGVFLLSWGVPPRNWFLGSFQQIFKRETGLFHSPEFDKNVEKSQKKPQTPKVKVLLYWGGYYYTWLEFNR